MLGVSPHGSKFVCLVLRRRQVASAVLLDSGTITKNEIHMCAKKYRSVACIYVTVLYTCACICIYLHLVLYQPESGVDFVRILMKII